MPLADNVTNHNAFLRTLEDKGKIKNANGGRDLTEPLLYGEYSNAKWYDGYETFTVDTSEEVVTAAVYEWKQLGGFAFISGREEHQNMGKQAAVDRMTVWLQPSATRRLLPSTLTVSLTPRRGVDSSSWLLMILLRQVPRVVSTRRLRHGGETRPPVIWRPSMRPPSSRK
jgi:hypothetical protein